jgi:hypothetical protein
MGCIPTGVDLPMAYGNMYTQMPYLPTPTVYPFAASAYSPIAMLYPPTSTDIVSQKVRTTTTSSSSKPEKSIKLSESI